jgi:hypothetical protein
MKDLGGGRGRDVKVGDALAVLRGLAVPEPVAPPEGQMGLFGAEGQP